MQPIPMMQLQHQQPQHQQPQQAGGGFAQPLVVATAVSSGQDASMDAKKKRGPATPWKKMYTEAETQLKAEAKSRRMQERRARFFESLYHSCRSNQLHLLSAAISKTHSSQDPPEALYNLLGSNLESHHTRFDALLDTQTRGQLASVLTSDEIRVQAKSSADASSAPISAAQLASSTDLAIQQRDQSMHNAWVADLTPKLTTQSAREQAMFDMEQLMHSWRADITMCEGTFPALRGPEHVNSLRKLIEHHRRCIVLLAAGVSLLLKHSE